MFCVRRRPGSHLSSRNSKYQVKLSQYSIVNEMVVDEIAFYTAFDTAEAVIVYSFTHHIQLFTSTQSLSNQCRWY